MRGCIAVPNRLFLVFGFKIAVIYQLSVFHKYDPFPKRNGFLIVICHIEDSDAQFAVDPLDIFKHLTPPVIVLPCKIFIYEKDFRLTYDGTSQRDPLALRVGDGSEFCGQDV